MRQLVFSHLTRVQSPWLKYRLFPWLLMCLRCFVWLVRRVLEGLQWKEAGCGWLNNSPVHLPVPTQLERLAETLTCCESQVAVLWCPQVLPGWELTPHKIPFWAGGAIPSMLCSDTSQEWITSPRGAFPGSSKSLSTTTKPIMLLWCWIQCSSLLFIFSLMEKGSLFGWEGNKLLDEYKQLSQIHYKGEILTVHVFLVAKPQWIYIYYSMQAVLICKVVINCKNR